MLEAMLELEDNNAISEQEFLAVAKVGAGGGSINLAPVHTHIQELSVALLMCQGSSLRLATCVCHESIGAGHCKARHQAKRA
jgi:hypothetical protein